jgi:integrase
MTSKLAVVGGESARSLPAAIPQPDPRTVLQAQEYVQLGLALLAQAQGYRGDETLGQLFDAWLRSCRRLSETTQNGYAKNVRSFLCELARLTAGRGPGLLGALTMDELEELGRALPIAGLARDLVERAIDGLSTGRWNSVTTCLRAGFAWANGHGFAGAGMLRPQVRRYQPRALVLPKGAWAKAAHLLYDHFEAAPPRSRPTAAAALCSVRWGVRRRAVARLEWSSIVDGEVRVVDKRRPRIVVLDELDKEILASLPRRGRYVFAGRGNDTRDRHVAPSSVTHLARRILRPAGLDLTLHQAGRHAAGISILENGGSTDDVVAHLGHADDRVTRKHYLTGVTIAGPARELLRTVYDQGAPERTINTSARKLAREREAELVGEQLELEFERRGR